MVNVRPVEPRLTQPIWARNGSIAPSTLDRSVPSSVAMLSNPDRAAVGDDAQVLSVTPRQPLPVTRDHLLKVPPDCIDICATDADPKCHADLAKQV